MICLTYMSVDCHWCPIKQIHACHVLSPIIADMHTQLHINYLSVDFQEKFKHCDCGVIKILFCLLKWSVQPVIAILTQPIVWVEPRLSVCLNMFSSWRVNSEYIPPVCNEDLLFGLLQCICNILHVGFAIHIPGQLNFFFLVVRYQRVEGQKES